MRRIEAPVHLGHGPALHGRGAAGKEVVVTDPIVRLHLIIRLELIVLADPIISVSLIIPVDPIVRVDPFYSYNIFSRFI